MNRDARISSLEEVTAVLDADFKALRAGNAAEISAVKKHLDKLRYGWACSVETRIVEIFLREEIKHLPSLDDCHLKAVLESLTVFWIHSAHKLRSLFLDLVLTYIQHPNGGVREAARHHAKNARLASARAHESEADSYIRFLKRFAAVTQKQREAAKIETPLRSYHDVDDLPPCPYKSMCLAWEDLNMKNVHEQWVTDEESLKLGMPVYGVEGEYVEEQTVEIEEVREKLWRRNKNMDDALRALQRLQAGAEHRFEEALRYYNMPLSEMHSARGLIQTLGPWDGGVFVFEQLINRRMKEEGIHFNILDYTLLLRASQGFSNNVIVYNSRSEPYTALLVGAVLQRERENRNIPKNLANFLQHCADAQDACDEVVPLVRAIRQKDIDEVKTREKGMSEEMKARFGKDDFYTFLSTALTKDNVMYDRLTSIAHHALDWYIQVEPWGVERCSPRKLTARIFDAIREINLEHNPASEVFAHMPKSFFSYFGGWSGPAGVNNYLVPHILRHVRDIDIILVEPNGVDKPL